MSQTGKYKYVASYSVFSNSDIKIGQWQKETGDQQLNNNRSCSHFNTHTKS